VGYLLEEGVVKNNQLVVPNKKQALNKIGHAMHDLDPVFERFSYTPYFMGLLKGLQYVDPVLV
jgi:phytanoyl-CoA hydroxylase